MKQFLHDLGIREGDHILLHSSYRKIRSAFPDCSIPRFISTLQDLITGSGSLIMPSFTYNYSLYWGPADSFSRLQSPGKTGAITEVFRNMDGIIRTSSPTHSFLLSGRVKDFIHADNSPESPLGKGSLLEWLSDNPDTYILLMGTDFTSNTLCHYIEILAKLPWIGNFPPASLGIKKAGVSIHGEQKLKEIPGCSLPFINFEIHLLHKNLISPVVKGDLKAYFIPVHLLLYEGKKFFTESPQLLLCEPGSCNDCDVKRRYLVNHE